MSFSIFPILFLSFYFVGYFFLIWKTFLGFSLNGIVPEVWHNPIKHLSNSTRLSSAFKWPDISRICDFGGLCRCRRGDSPDYRLSSLLEDCRPRQTRWNLSDMQLIITWYAMCWLQLIKAITTKNSIGFRIIRKPILWYRGVRSTNYPCDSLEIIPQMNSDNSADGTQICQFVRERAVPPLSGLHAPNRADVSAWPELFLLSSLRCRDIPVM